MPFEYETNKLTGSESPAGPVSQQISRAVNIGAELHDLIDRIEHDLAAVLGSAVACLGGAIAGAATPAKEAARCEMHDHLLAVNEKLDGAARRLSHIRDRICI